MDDTKTTTKERLSVLETPPTSHVSLILNGAFNGATIGSMPSVVHALTQKFKTGEMPVKTLGAANIFFIVAGTAIGAWFGAREAHNLTAYQNAVSDEIQQLRADLDAQAEKRTVQAR